MPAYGFGTQPFGFSPFGGQALADLPAADYALLSGLTASGGPRSHLSRHLRPTVTGPAEAPTAGLYASDYGTGY